MQGFTSAVALRKVQLESVAVCGSVLQGVAVCYQCRCAAQCATRVCCTVLHCAVMCCSMSPVPLHLVLQCAAVFWGVLPVPLRCAKCDLCSSSMAGIKKASVLPEPVFACANKSRPASSGLIVLAWICERFSNPWSAMPFFVSSHMSCRSNTSSDKIPPLFVVCMTWCGGVREDTLSRKREDRGRGRNACLHAYVYSHVCVCGCVRANICA